MSGFKDKCKKCQSEDTYIKHGKVGMFVSYWTIICNACGHKENCRG